MATWVQNFVARDWPKIF